MTRQATIDVCIVHRERVWREALSRVLTRLRDIRVVDHRSPNDDQPLPMALEKLKPDVLLLDLDWPECSGISRIRQLLFCGPEMRILLTGIPDRDSEIIAAIEAGAAGYLTRSSGIDDVIANIRALAAGKALCSQRIARLLFRRVASTVDAQPPTEQKPAMGIHLTPRELQVMTLIEEGLSNKDIARRLIIGLQTVKNHVHNILVKLSLQRRTEVAHYMRQNGLSDRKSTGTRMLSS